MEKETAKSDSLIVSLANKVNKGLDFFRNKGIKMVRDEYIAFADASTSQNQAGSSALAPGKTRAFFPHVEGLRGVAIFLILLFHLGTVGLHSPVKLSGGYFGVEMFLVISGYFLALGFAKRHESVREFASKKLLRIFYPMAVTVLITLVLGLFCMDYADIKTMACSAMAALGGCINYVLSESSSGYFAAETAYNPLMHMWYLAISLQVYLLCYIGYRILRHRSLTFKSLVILLFIEISLLYAYAPELRREVIKFIGLPEWVGAEGSMYYSTLARLWEPLCGMAILLMVDIRKAWLKSLVCLLAMVAIGWCVYDASTSLMPVVVISTMLLVKYLSGSLFAFLFENKYVRWLGKISFSAYLLHMPLYVCYKCFTMSWWGWFAASMLLVASILLGWLFWKYVEQSKVRFLVLMSAWGGAMGASCALFLTNGLRDYLHVESNKIELPRYENPHACQWKELQKNWDSKKAPNNSDWAVTNVCPSNLGKPWALQMGPDDICPSFALLGDSHAQHLIPGLDAIAHEMGVSGVFPAVITIPFWDRYDYRYSNYKWDEPQAKAIMNWLKRSPQIKTVILAQLWSRPNNLKLNWKKANKCFKFEDNMKAFEVFVDMIKGMKKDVIVVAPIPYYQAKDSLRWARFLARTNQQPEEVSNSDYVVTLEQFDEGWYRQVRGYLHKMKNAKKIQVLYPHHHLFEGQKAYMYSNGKLHYRDHSHISVDASRYIFKKMRSNLEYYLKTKLAPAEK